MKRTWMSLRERIDLALRHLIKGLDRRPIVKGTALEGVPFCSISMGERLVRIHAVPDLFECPGRYLTALSLCIDSNPSYLVSGESALNTAEHLISYLDKRVNRQGKMEVTEREMSLIDSTDQVFLENPGSKEASSVARGWWDAARGVIYDGHVLIPLEGLVRWYLRTGDGTTKKTIQRAIQGKMSDPASPEIQAGKGMVQPALILPLAMYYEATGDAATKSYLDEIAGYFLRKRYLEFFPDGKHCHGDGVGHLHSRFHGIAGFARYAKLTGRRDYLSAAEELLAVNTSYGAEFGWMPERHIFSYQSKSDSGTTYQPWAVGAGQTIDFYHYARPRHGWDTCEICVTADAIEAAIFLAQCGYEKYWDIAERYLNHVFESQIRDDSFIVERERGGMDEKIGATFKNVRDDILGGFLSYTSPTWAVSRRQYPRMRRDGREGVCEGKYYGVGVACCHGWGARTLGLIWHNIVTEDGNKVEVNFPFDRKTEKVEVKSGLPFSGKISVKVLKPVELFVRIPDWVEHSSVEIRLNRKRQDTIEFKNSFSDYVKFGKLKPGDKVEVRYPLRVEKKRYHIEYHPCLYEANWLGNYVLGMKEIAVSKGQGEELFTGIGDLYQY